MFRFFFTCAMFALALGCNQSPAEPKSLEVSGTVKLNGAPLKEGTIAFVPEKTDGFPAPTSPIVDGAFKVKARPGANKVEIRSPKDSGKKNSTGGVIIEETIPPQYNEKTTLTSNVAGEMKDVVFDLKK